MLRTLAWLLVVWGVAVWATWGFQVVMGVAPAQNLIAAGIGGGILVAVGYWLERRTRRKPPDRQEGKPLPPSDLG
jgi:hypothetical protein